MAATRSAASERGSARACDRGVHATPLIPATAFILGTAPTSAAPPPPEVAGPPPRAGHVREGEVDKDNFPEFIPMLRFRVDELTEMPIVLVYQRQSHSTITMPDPRNLKGGSISIVSQNDEDVLLLCPCAAALSRVLMA